MPHKIYKYYIGKVAKLFFFTSYSYQSLLNMYLHSLLVLQIMELNGSRLHFRAIKPKLMLRLLW